MALSSNQKKGLVVAGAGMIGIAALLLLRPKSSAAVAEISLDAAPQAGQPPLTVAFSGNATDSAGKGVGGVSLGFFVDGLNQASVVTAQDGSFSFTATFDVPGTYTCVVSSGAVQKTVSVSV